jgi:hypothetical protein
LFLWKMFLITYSDLLCRRGGTKVMPAFVCVCVCVHACRNYTYGYNKMYIYHAYILYKV